MRKVVVTGATGFIGSRLVADLCANGVEVFCLVREQDELAPDLPAKALTCSLADLSPAISMLQEADIDVIYHLAWDGVSSTVKNDYDLQLANISYSLNVCKFAQAIACKHIIMTGSASEYALSAEPVSGKGKPQPVDAYAAVKAAVHLICEQYCRAHSILLDWCLVSSIYGPGRFDANVITYTIESLLRGEKPQFTSLEQMWDYLYIDDLVCALEAVGKRSGGDCGKTYAVGSGDGRPLREFIEIVRDAVDPNAPLGIGERDHRASTLDNLVIDTSALTADTGFRPQVSFEEGIAQTVAAFRAHYDIQTKV